MSQALYNRYRPTTFAEVIGQDHVTQALSSALTSGRIHHAYLFSGPRGCGKTSSARILAASLNCVDGPTPTPCGVCEHCTSIRAGSSMDVVEIDAASHGGVDDARDLRERAVFTPASARFKVYVIDEAHQVTREGFNALLKLVEEPPPHLKFVFATTEPDRVLQTIRSRTHHYAFRLVSPGVLRDHLANVCRQEGVDVDPAVLPLVVRAGAGSVRDSLSVLDQMLAGAGEGGLTTAAASALLGLTDSVLLDDAVDALVARDGSSLFGVVDRVVTSGHDPRRFATDLLERLRDLMILDAVPDAPSRGMLEACAPDQLDRMRGQAGRMGGTELSRAADVVHDGLVQMRGTTNPRLLLELVLARALLPGSATDPASLLVRLERIERRLAATGDAPVQPAVGSSGPGPVRAPARPRVPGAADRPPPPADPTPTEAAPPVAATPAEDTAPAEARRATAAPIPEAAQQRPATAPPGTDTPPAEPAPSAPEPADPAAPTWGTSEPVPPEPVGGSTTAGAGAAGAVDVESLRRMWDEVLRAVRGRSRTSEAILSQYAEVVGVDAGRVTLAFSNPAMARNLSRGNHEDNLREALAEVVGGTWSVVVQTSAADTGTGPSRGARPPRAGSPPPQPEPADAGPDDASPDDEELPSAGTGEEAAVALLRDGLGARVVEERGSR